MRYLPRLVGLPTLSEHDQLSRIFSPIIMQLVIIGLSQRYIERLSLNGQATSTGIRVERPLRL